MPLASGSCVDGIALPTSDEGWMARRVWTSRLEVGQDVVPWRQLQRLFWTWTRLRETVGACVRFRGK